jgi:hypothetical protein
LIFHGGDLADGGGGPVEIVDQIRDLGWQGVVGNTDEMLFKPESLEEFAKPSPQLADLFAVIEEMAVWTREALGEERLCWLRELPRMQNHGPMALVHSSLESLWRAPAHTASDAELESVSPVGCSVLSMDIFIELIFGPFSSDGRHTGSRRSFTTAIAPACLLLEGQSQSGAWVRRGQGT